MDKVKIAILGSGNISKHHAHTLRGNPSAQVVGVCDVSDEIVSAFIADQFRDYEHPQPGAFTDPAQMYQQTQPDGVLIATPHTLHFDHAMQALDAGLHVLLEKPMVTNAQQAYELAAKAEQTGKIVTIGYNTPCTAEFRYLRDCIRAGAFGRLELISGWLTQAWRTATADTWRQKPELSGGGMAYDSGAHILNSVCWTVESRVAQVHAFVDNLDTPVDINSSINIRFENGVFAVLAIGGNCTDSGSHLTYAFEHGRVDVDGWIGSWINVHQDRQRVKYPPITHPDQLPTDNFIDAVLGRGEPLTSPMNGIIHSELMDAIYESARTGQPAQPKAPGG